LTAYLIRRLIQAIIVIVLVSVIVFAVIRFLPGDPVLIYLTKDTYSNTNPAQINALRAEYGLDKPVIIQYINWMGDVLRGDLGRSIHYRTTVNSEIATALPITLSLSFVAFFLSIILGIPLGIIAAVRRGKWQDTVSTFLANLGISAPQFWVGILLILLLGFYLHWLPLYGYTSPFEDIAEYILHIIMPVICLVVYPMAAIARQTRSSMLEVIRQDYIRTAWSKGLTEREIIMKHAARNAIIPVITLAGMNIRQIFGGQVLVETVFNIPGMGRLAVDALFVQDYAIVQAVILVTATAVVFTNLLVDFSYGWIDPRIRQR
jgi:peptide/nickel transport system permease protein